MTFTMTFSIWTYGKMYQQMSFRTGTVISVFLTKNLFVIFHPRDHDDDVSVAEACKKLNEISGFRGMGR